MTKQLSVVIVGAGNIAGGYDANRREGDDGVYSHAGAYRAHGGFRLATVFDSVPARAETFRESWKVERTAASLNDILQGRHDVVSVCSPDASHFPILEAVLSARCCRTVFVEKPLALGLEEIERVITLAEQTGINVVCNFQRRFEPVHAELHRRIQENPKSLLSASGHYIKGLRHVGVTLVDSLVYLCGTPDAVIGYNRVYNAEARDFTYEFILFYPGFTAAIKTVDADRYVYNYHVFELDLLFADGRATLVDVSQGLRESSITDYAYSGVRILNEKEARYRDTAFKQSMVAAATYVHNITTGAVTHTVNTPQSSYTNALIVARIEESFHAGVIKLKLGTSSWKR